MEFELTVKESRIVKRVICKLFSTYDSTRLVSKNDIMMINGFEIGFLDV
jgi:hypothetical protein